MSPRVIYVTAMFGVNAVLKIPRTQSALPHSITCLLPYLALRLVDIGPAKSKGKSENDEFWSVSSESVFCRVLDFRHTIEWNLPTTTILVA